MEPQLQIKSRLTVSCWINEIALNNFSQFLLLAKALSESKVGALTSLPVEEGKKDGFLSWS